MGIQRSYEFISSITPLYPSLISPIHFSPSEFRFVLPLLAQSKPPRHLAYLVRRFPHLHLPFCWFLPLTPPPPHRFYEVTLPIMHYFPRRPPSSRDCTPSHIACPALGSPNFTCHFSPPLPKSPVASSISKPSWRRSNAVPILFLSSLQQSPSSPTSRRTPPQRWPISRC